MRAEASEGKVNKTFRHRAAKFFFSDIKAPLMTTERSFFAFYVLSTSPEHAKERGKKKKLFFWNSANDRKWSRPRSSPKDVFFSFLLSTFLLFRSSRRPATTNIFLLVWFGEEEDREYLAYEFTYFEAAKCVCFCPEQTSDDDDWWCFYMLFTSASCDLIESRRRIRSRRRRFIEIKIENSFSRLTVRNAIKSGPALRLASITRPLRNGF